MKRTPAHRASMIAVFFVALAVVGGSCSIPNLESPDCTAARQAVIRFYSFHFGGEMKFSPAGLALRERFLTPEFAALLKDVNTDGDVFTTKSTDIPKAFSVGACEPLPSGAIRVSVLLFWRDNVRSEQRRIYAETVKRGGDWLINNISE